MRTNVFAYVVQDNGFNSRLGLQSRKLKARAALVAMMTYHVPHQKSSPVSSRVGEIFEKENVPGCLGGYQKRRQIVAVVLLCNPVVFVPSLFAPLSTLSSMDTSAGVTQV